MKHSYKRFVAAFLMVFLIALAVPTVASAADAGGNLVAHYTFDNDFKDSSGNANDGTNVGDVTFADDAVFGKSAVFTGGYLNVASKPELNLGSKFTISVWVKISPDLAGHNVSVPIISKLDDRGNYNNYHAYARGTFGAGMGVKFTNGDVSVQNGGFEDFGLADDWSHLVFSCDGQALYLYHNGTLKATKEIKAGGSVKSSESNMRIGTGNDLNNSNLIFKGMMDDMRIYDYALSSAEIKALYDASGAYNHKIVLQVSKSTMMVDDKEQEIDPGRGTVPVIVSSRTLVPIRAIIEAMGGTIGWTQSEQRVDITLKSKHLQLWIDRTTATLNGTQLTMDVPPKLMNQRTMLPLRFISENLGCKVEWDGKTQKVTVSYNK